MRRFSFTLIFIFIFNGCVKSYNDSYKIKYLQSTAVTNFSKLTESLIDDLCPTLEELKLEQRKLKPLYIIDFVNLNQLENHSELGFMLSDELKTHVTQECDWPIHQIEYTKYLKIGENGTKLLSRDLKDMKNKKLNSNTYALVGTYAFTQRQLILYLKIIDLKTGVILKSATKRTELTDEIIQFEKKPKEKFEVKNIYQPMVL